MSLPTIKQLGFLSLLLAGLVVIATAVSGVANIGSRLEASSRVAGPTMSRVSLIKALPETTTVTTTTTIIIITTECPDWQPAGGLTQRGPDPTPEYYPAI